MAGRGTSEPYRPRTGNVDDRPGTDTCSNGPVEAGRENIRQTGEVLDLRHRLIFVREAQQIEVRIGDHDVISLPADPASHVDIAVGGTGARGVHVETNAGLAFLAVATATAGNVKGHGYEVAHSHKLDVAPGLDDLARDLVAENEPSRCRGTAPHHVLVAPADIGAHHFEDHAVVAAAAVQCKNRELDGLQFDLARFNVGNTSVVFHSTPQSLILGYPSSSSGYHALTFNR